MLPELIKISFAEKRSSHCSKACCARSRRQSRDVTPLLYIQHNLLKCPDDVRRVGNLVLVRALTAASSAGRMRSLCAKTSLPVDTSVNPVRLNDGFLYCTLTSTTSLRTKWRASVEKCSKFVLGSVSLCSYFPEWCSFHVLRSSNIREPQASGMTPCPCQTHQKPSASLAISRSTRTRLPAECWKPRSR